MREGAVPVKDLDDEGKGKAREMEYPDRPVLRAPKGTEEKKEDPEEMDEDDDIGKDLVSHDLNLPYKRILSKGGRVTPQLWVMKNKGDGSI